MLDECKGERLEEVLAVFSSAVLKKVLLDGASGEHDALARQLALENFSYVGERTVLLAFILAHKASLSKRLREKKELRARCLVFSDLLNLNDRRISRRHEQLKEAIEEHGSQAQLAPSDVLALQGQVHQNWSGNTEWLEAILYGDSRSNGEGLLAIRFDKLWKHVEQGTIGDAEGKARAGLLEQLDARVKDQENRLARWQDFSKTLSMVGVSSPAKQVDPTSAKRKKIDLNFNQHQSLQCGHKCQEDFARSSTASFEDYNRLIENMKSELSNVGRPREESQRPTRKSVLNESESASLSSSEGVPKDNPSDAQDEEWSSASDTDEASFESIVPGVAAPLEALPREEQPSVKLLTVKQSSQQIIVDPTVKVHSFSLGKAEVSRKDAINPPKRAFRTPPPVDPPQSAEAVESEANDILDSVSAASPSPKKPRHTLSLAERTRLSMSRTSHAQYSDLHEDFDLAELPRLSIKPKPPVALKVPSVEGAGKHADLIERTRKSMAGFEAAQKKAQMDRRKSMKDAKQKQRESSYFPKVEEELEIYDVSAIELLEGDPDYESVFKSRPKIKTSPAVSPTRTADDD